MKQQDLKSFGIAVLSLAAIVVSLHLTSAPMRANDDDVDFDRSQDKKIEIGIKITPVPLNLDGKDREMVGYGSYLVNAQQDCNGCHTADPATEYLPQGNPYFGSKKPIVNTATYLGGGQDFGALIPGSAHIISRNLTPDKTGRPEGGHSFRDFLEIMRTGKDFDHLHPTCAGAPEESCVPKPFDGSLLQVMPWPTYKRMTTGDIRAIYEYLGAIPCVAGPPAPSNLHNDCE